MLIFLTLVLTLFVVEKNIKSLFAMCHMDMNYSVIKERLSEEIKTCGLTTVQIAQKVGVSPEMITQYCTTKKMPKLDTFAKICKELDLDANYILGLDE